MSILVTGAAGFIGFHLCKKLIDNGEDVLGIDNLNNYYDVNLKKARLKKLLDLNAEKGSFKFFEISLEETSDLTKVFRSNSISKVVNLAAQAGVRYSLENPSAYIKSNIVGFANILECSKNFKINNLIYASSSSVYGGNTLLPFCEDHSVDHPVSLYASSKKSNELMAHTYSHLYNIPTTGLRFFTVYGPWGRPDMALFLFTKAIINNQPIDIYNYGKMVRDFTYIDDIVESIQRLIKKPATSNNQFNTTKPNSSTSWAPYRIFNIGNSKPTQLMDYIKAIEKNLGKEAIKNYMPIQPGDVVSTSADTSKLEEWIKFKPNTTIDNGVKKFINWYIDFYNPTI